MDWKIFRAYDIRGIYPDQVNEDAYYRIAKAYVSLFKPVRMIVGMDARLSSPSLTKSLVNGFLDAGVDVLDIGGVTTDMLYFAVGKYGYSGGIVVSASHNPREYNGMKLVREGATAISSDTGLFDIRDALMANADMKVTSPKRGAYDQKDILADYVHHVLTFIDQSAIRRLSFVGNANFGYVNRPVQAIAERLGLDLKPLNFEPDGSFPKGPPDPMLPDNRVEVEMLVKSSEADFGVAWDADADRVMFFDEEGQFISGAYVTALLADILLERYGRNKIIFDPRVIWPTLRVLEKRHGEPIISKGGHAFMKDRMRKEDALFAGEMSAHYYFRDNFYADNGIIPFLLVVEHLSKKAIQLSEVMRPYTEGHYMSGELNYHVDNIDRIIAAVKARFDGRGKDDFTDGYSLEGDQWRFNIRPSNTEPLLRLNIEARRKGLVDQIKAEIEEIINGPPD